MVLGMILGFSSALRLWFTSPEWACPSNFQKKDRNRSPPTMWLFGRQGSRTLSAGRGGAGSSAPEYGYSGCGAAGERWVVGVRSGSAPATLICGFRCISLCFSSDCPPHRDSMSVKVPGHLCRSQCLNRGTTTKSAVSPTRRCDISSAKNNDSKAVRNFWVVPAKGGGVSGGVSCASY